MNAVLNTAASARRPAFGKVVIVTRKMQLEELVARFNSVPQARFYIEHAGQAFSPIAARHARYHAVLDRVREAVPRGLKSQVIERAFLLQFSFGEPDLVMTVGPDGLVVNVAKYLQGQPVFALNPDPGNIDGALLPFSVERFARRFARSLRWWFVSLPAGIGLGTGRAVMRLWLGYSPARSGVRSAGNGAAMRGPDRGHVR